MSGEYNFKKATQLETAWLNEGDDVLSLRFKGKATLYHYRTDPMFDTGLTAKTAFNELILQDLDSGAGSFFCRMIKPFFKCEKEEPKQEECRLCRNGQPFEDGLCKSCFEIEAVDGEWQGRAVV